MQCRWQAIVWVWWAVTLCAGVPAKACSTFLIRHDSILVFGNNYDWHLADGLVIVNKRGMQKNAVADTLPARWVSRYGSVTFNQYGREMPHVGMNERGLTIGLMWLAQTEYPPVDRRSAVGELEWIQYMLDNCATVAEVVAMDSVVRIRPRAPAPLHFLVCDTTGSCAAIEFLRGRQVVHSGEGMPVRVLTNTPYEEALAEWRAHGKRGRLERESSIARFIRAGSMLSLSQPRNSVEAVARAFEILDSISVGNGTAWSIVADLVARTVYYHTVRYRAVRYIRLSDCDFRCRTPVLVADINARGRGNMARHFSIYTYEANLKLVRNTFRSTDFLAHMSSEQIVFNARIPETHTRCIGE